MGQAQKEDEKRAQGLAGEKGKSEDPAEVFAVSVANTEKKCSPVARRPASLGAVKSSRGPCSCFFVCLFVFFLVFCFVLLFACLFVCFFKLILAHCSLGAQYPGPR